LLGESRAKVDQKSAIGAVGAGAVGAICFFVKPGSGEAVKGDVICECGESSCGDWLAADFQHGVDFILG